MGWLFPLNIFNYTFTYHNSHLFVIKYFMWYGWYQDSKTKNIKIIETILIRPAIFWDLYSTGLQRFYILCLCDIVLQKRVPFKTLNIYLHSKKIKQNWQNKKSWKKISIYKSMGTFTEPKYMLLCTPSSKMENLTFGIP